MKTKSLKILAMLLSCLLVFGMMPITSWADAPEISITSHKNGDVIAGGENVLLQAEWNIAEGTIKRVDFYANDNKLPGYVTASGETLIWESPSPGTYTLKAVATLIDENTVPSAEVSVFVKAENIVSSMTPDALTNNWRYYWKNSKFTEYSNAYGVMEEKSILAKAGDNVPVSWDEDITIKSTDYINILMYVEGVPENTQPSVILSAMVGTDNKLYKAPTATLKNGWMTVSRCLGVDATIDYLMLYFAEYVNATYKDSIKLYVNGFYLSDAPLTADGLKAEPVIPDNQEAVCNEIDTYRINFSRPLAVNLTSADLEGAVEVSTDGTALTGITVEPGTDYIDVKGLNLNVGTEYTIKVNGNKVQDIYGFYYGGSEFTFTTIGNGCTETKPIPRITYPKEGSAISSGSMLTASVIFSENVNEVEFFEVADGGAETSLGKAVKATGNEWVLDNPTLSAGSHKIIAKATTSSTVETSEAVNFTSVKTDYRLVGIENGDVLVLNEEYGKTVSVIDNSTETFKTANGNQTYGTAVYNAIGATASNVSKVVYYLNGTKVAENTSAPYTAELSINKIGTNTLKVDIYDTLGGITPIEKTFEAIYGYVNKSWSEDFDGETPKIPENMVNQSSAANLTYTTLWSQEVKHSSYTNSNALYINSGAEVKESGTYRNISIGLWPDDIDVASNTNRVFLEFDYTPSYYGANADSICLIEGYKDGKGGSADYGIIELPISVFQNADRTDKTTHLGFDISWDNTKDSLSYKVYINGWEYYRYTSPIAYRDKVDPAKLTAAIQHGAANNWYWYIDNINVTAYNTPDNGWTLFGDNECVREFTQSGEAEIVVVNNSNEASVFSNLVAIYNADDTLASVIVDDITLAGKSISEKKYDLTLQQGQKARIFTWLKNTLTPVELK